MSQVPDEAECLVLLRSAGCAPDVIEHVQAVARLADAFCDRCPDAERRIVKAGALLHDIGRSVSHGLDHVVQGVMILEALAVDDRVIAIVKRHVGAGIDDATARDHGWPLHAPDDYIPQRLEERLVAHADNLTFNDEYASMDRLVQKMEQRGHADLVPRMRDLHARVALDLGEDPDDIARRLSAAPGA